MENKLREVREAKNLTQEELAKLSGVSRGTIQRIERARGEEQNVTVKSLQQICDALDESILDIFFQSAV